MVRYGGRAHGSVQLFHRDFAIRAQRTRGINRQFYGAIEAGREMMIGGICESPLTIQAILSWHDAMMDGKMLLRDVIDLDATYGNNAFEAEAAGLVAADAEGVAPAEETEEPVGGQQAEREGEDDNSPIQTDFIGPRQDGGGAAEDAGAGKRHG